MDFIISIWQTLCELSPWLLLGMFLSGLLHVVLPANFARLNLQGFWGVVKSVAIGVPLPLCSCGVIPTGLGLKRDGASSGSAVAFLISTPQTGIDSVLVSASFFGLPFAIFKVVAAAVMGVVGGWLTDRETSTLHTEAKSSLPVISSSPDQAAPTEPPAKTFRGQIVELVAHAVEMLRSIWIWLVLGILISAIINQLQLQTFFHGVSAVGLLPAMLLVLLFSIPLYVCATASVPIAASLVAGGLPPAVALVFLMAGPATNVATIGAIRSQLGNRALTVYLAVIVIGSMLSAWVFDGLIDASGLVQDGLLHAHDHQSWWAALASVVVVGLICLFVWERLQKRFLLKSTRHADGPSVTVNVSGMTCGNCVSKLERELRKIPGAESAVVSLEKRSAKVFGDVAAEAVRTAIVAAGFEPVA